MESKSTINIRIINVVEKTDIIKTIDIISKNDKLIELCQRTNETNPNISFNSYYIFDFELFLNEYKLPYILRDGSIYWNVPIDTVTLSEFMHTHDIALNDGITVETGYPMAGGRGDFFDVIDIWVNAWPIIKEFAPHAINTVSFLSSSLALVQWLKIFQEKKKKDIPYPYHFIDLIYKRPMWNHHELAKLLNISVDDAKKWLTALSYKWDNSIKAYVVSEEDKNKNKNKINDVKRYPDF